MWDKVGTKNWRRPLLLRADNFTPPQRTPWGGRRIVEHLKSEERIEAMGPIGEAWELSVEPDFPSRLADGPLLDEILRAEPALLGREAPLGSTALLVKLVDAADHLSLQIHPADGDPHLATDESGKPEAWYIVDAEPGAGLYLGFRQGVSREEVRERIEAGGRLDALMSFVPVNAGDLFLVEPGTAHAIGKGVLLLEPQRVTPGKRGVTYRYWDWNRRYDEEGRPSPTGIPRDLHLERALELTDWEGPRGRALVDRIRYPSGTAQTRDSATVETLVSKTGPLQSECFFLRRLAGSGRVELPVEDRLRAFTVLEGSAILSHGDERIEVRQGRTAAIPAGLDIVGVDLRRAHAILSTLA
jgi:mannose-6-phosphate isomerase class I